ncbi:MAG: DegV family protein [Desulfobacterales bacterium]|nr:DegV family protein [Desulfobacterales bacterium]
MKRLIVTDSTADIPVDLSKELSIQIMPVNLVLNNKSFRDGVDVTRSAFYQNFDTYTTMTSEPVRYEDYALKLLQLSHHYDEIIAIHCSSHLSDTYAIAENVSQEFMEKSNCRVAVIDSGQCSMGLGMIVLGAAKATQEGKTFEQTCQVVEQISQSMHSYMAIPTLKYLKKGKKINGMKAMFGLALGVKPVLEMQDGKMQIKSKLLGQQKNMILSMMDRIKQDVAGRPISLSIIYAGNDKLIHSLRNVFDSSFECRQIYISRFSPSIAINTGPESYAVFFTPYA